MFNEHPHEAAKQWGINMPENYVPSMDDAIAAGDGVLIKEAKAAMLASLSNL